MNLSGHWIGHYTNPSAPHQPHPAASEATIFPIEATLFHREELLVGTMVDHITEVVEPLTDVNLRLQTLGPPNVGFDDWLSLWPKALLTYVLPRDSWIEGYVVGNLVSFQNVYVGDHSSYVDYQAGTLCTQRLNPHVVIYQAEIATDGDRMHGTWIIPSLSLATQFFPGHFPGTFELTRTAIGASP